MILSLGNSFALASNDSALNENGDTNFETIYVDIDLAEISEFGKYAEIGSRTTPQTTSGTKTVNIDGGKIKCYVTYTITYFNEPSVHAISSYTASLENDVKIDTSTYDGVTNMRLSTSKPSPTTLRFTINLDARLSSGSNAGIWVARSGSADVSV